MTVAAKVVRRVAPKAISGLPEEWWLTLLWLIVTSYNLFKPFRVDDAAHLEIASWIAAHPLHPMSGFLNWDGTSEPIHVANQPHLYFYLMAAWGSAFGYSEIAMHTLESIFALAAILLFYRIAKKLAPSNSLWLTAMLALSPSFFIEQNTMVDVPLLSLWLVFFGALIVDADAEDRQQGRRFLIAAIACSAALLTKYSSLLLLPILAFTIIYERRGRYAWVLLIPLFVLVSWSLFNYFDYGGIHIAGGGRSQSASPQFRSVRSNFAAYVLALGAITPLGLVAAVRLLPPLRRAAASVYSATFLALALAVGGVAIGRLNENVIDILRVSFLLNFCSMFTAIGYLIARRVAERNPTPTANSTDLRLLILLLWISGHLAFYSLFAFFMAVRHVLLFFLRCCSLSVNFSRIGSRLQIQSSV
jgi:hypothetical protein